MRRIKSLFGYNCVYVVYLSLFQCLVGMKSYKMHTTNLIQYRVFRYIVKYLGVGPLYISATQPDGVQLALWHVCDARQVFISLMSRSTFNWSCRNMSHILVHFTHWTMTKCCSLCRVNPSVWDNHQGVQRVATAPCAWTDVNTTIVLYLFYVLLGECNN